jgi:hypothetical protein
MVGFLGLSCSSLKSYSKYRKFKFNHPMMIRIFSLTGANKNMKFSKHPIPGLLVFVIHINDILLRIIPFPEPTSADDTISIISSKSLMISA